MTNEESQPLLPAGLCPIDLQSLEGICVDSFTGSPKRGQLMSGLKHFLSQLSALGVLGSAWIDGSFVTKKAVPGDIDLVIAFDATAINNLPHTEQLKLQALTNKADVQQRYGLDVYFFDETDIQWSTYWKDFFGYCRDRKTPKGIAVVTL